jgi:hypothetical protein
VQISLWESASVFQTHGLLPAITVTKQAALHAISSTLSAAYRCSWYPMQHKIAGKPKQVAGTYVAALYQPPSYKAIAEQKAQCAPASK